MAISYLPNAHELTQLTDDVALKGGPWPLRSLAGAPKIEM